MERLELVSDDSIARKNLELQGISVSIKEEKLTNCIQDLFENSNVNGKIMWYEDGELYSTTVACVRFVEMLMKVRNLKKKLFTIEEPAPHLEAQKNAQRELALVEESLTSIKEEMHDLIEAVNNTKNKKQKSSKILILKP